MGAPVHRHPDVIGGKGKSLGISLDTPDVQQIRPSLPLRLRVDRTNFYHETSRTPPHTPHHPPPTIAPLNSHYISLVVAPSRCNCDALIFTIESVNLNTPNSDRKRPVRDGGGMALARVKVTHGRMVKWLKWANFEKW